MRSGHRVSARQPAPDDHGAARMVPGIELRWRRRWAGVQLDRLDVVGGEFVRRPVLHRDAVHPVLGRTVAKHRTWPRTAEPDVGPAAKVLDRHARHGTHDVDEAARALPIDLVARDELSEPT